jgi:hypothetical protein
MQVETPLGPGRIVEAAWDLVVKPPRPRGSLMKINCDFRDLLHGLNAAEVRYLFVRGDALMVHTKPALHEGSRLD